MEAFQMMSHLTIVMETRRRYRRIHLITLFSRAMSRRAPVRSPAVPVHPI